LTEKQLQTLVMKKLRERGGEWVLYPRTRYAKAGVSDILGVYRGYAVAIELKPPENISYDLTPLQGEFLMRWATAGGEFIVAREWDFIEKFLSKLDARVQ
jgi:Holliday junction resolvase